MSPVWTRSISVTPERFEAQLEELARRGFESSSFTDAATGVGAEHRSLAITFDDAYRSVIKVAKPILDRYGMTATVFVPTALVSSDQPMSWPRIEGWTDPVDRAELMPMSWAELAELADAGWEIGSHGRTHPRMTDLDDEILTDELAGSKEDLETRLGRPCRSLAYPFGVFDDRVAAAAAQSGYTAGATQDPGYPDPSSPMACPRVSVYSGDAGWRFRLKIGRAGPALASARRLARRLPRPALRRRALQESSPRD